MITINVKNDGKKIRKLKFLVMKKDIQFVILLSGL